jgi:hypothetical protein
MDDIVRQAIAKWPNVPDCYGWLGLDARGNWYMRDDRAQAAGPFGGVPGADTARNMAAKGSLLKHDKLIDFIQRNYESDKLPAAGSSRTARSACMWNSKPRPWSGASARRPCLPSIRPHRAPARTQRCIVDEVGRVYLETDLGFGLVHTQDMTHAADAVEQGLWVPEEWPARDLPARFGYVRSPQALQDKPPPAAV